MTEYISVTIKLHKMRTCSWPPMNFYIINNLKKAHLMIPILLFKKVPVFMHMYMYACVCMHWRTTQTLVIRLNNKTLLTLHISSVPSTLPGTKAYTPYTVFWKMYFYFLCVCLHVCMCTTYITGFWEGQRGLSGPLVSELQSFELPCGAGSGAWVLCKKSKCSWPVISPVFLNKI